MRILLFKMVLKPPVLEMASRYAAGLKRRMMTRCPQGTPEKVRYRSPADVLYPAGVRSTIENRSKGRH